MHYFFKFTWFLRAVLYKLFFGKLSMPSYIGPPIFILNSRKIFIGSKVRIFPGLRAECHGKGKIFVHDNVSIGQNFHIVASDELNIGSGCLISGDVFITDTDHTFEMIGTPVFDQINKVSKTYIGENCFLGIGVRIQAGTTLGEGCIVGANSVVRGDFPSNSILVGAPARIVKRYNPFAGEWQRC